MIRIKELCKKSGITQAELAKKLDISASALAQSIAGNPSLDRIEAIAEALNVSVGELFPDSKSKLTALALYGSKSYKAETVEELRKITDLITIKHINENRMYYRINKPYGIVYDLENSKGELFNREYQLLGETKGTDSIYTMELDNMNLSWLSEDQLTDLFEHHRPERGRHVGFFYSDATNPFTEKEKVEDQLMMLEDYNYRMYKLYHYTSYPNNWYSIY
nr:helix-turn-helix transcriptional regulator [uncultured Bacteroides sp.]